MSRFIVLAGGGGKGAFHAGFLHETKRLGHLKTPHGIVGTSVGAVNLSKLVQHGRLGFCRAVDELLVLWERLLKSDRDVWRLKFPPYLAGLWSPSIAHVRPLERILYESVNQDGMRASDIVWRMTAVELETGKLELFGPESKDIVQSILASASIPVYFPPVEIDGRVYTDGGVRDIAPLKHAIDLGATEVMVIHTGSPNRVGGRVKSALEYAEAAMEIMAHEVLLNDVKMCLAYNKVAALGGDARHVKVEVVGPEIDLGSGLDFSESSIDQRVAHGRWVARKLYADPDSV